MDAVCSRNLLNKAVGKLVCPKHRTAIPEVRHPPPLTRAALTTPEARQRRRKKSIYENRIIFPSFNYPATRLTHKGGTNNPAALPKRTNLESGVGWKERDRTTPSATPRTSDTSRRLRRFLLGNGTAPGPPPSAAAYGIPRPAEPMGSSSPPPPPSPPGLALGSRASLRCPAVCKHPLTRGAGCLWDCPCSRCATGMLFFKIFFLPLRVRLRVRCGETVSCYACRSAKSNVS